MKRILLYNFLFAFVLLSLFSCGNGSKFRNQLCALDSALVAHPDSVYEVLQGMKEEAVTHSKSDRMYFELLQADAQNKAYIDFTTDSVMLKVADYYDKHGTPNEQMRAHYLLGCTYRDLKDVPMELQCFQEATEKADTTRNDCDLYTLNAIYGQMANLYHSQYLPEEELKVLQKSEEIATLDGDTLFAIKAYELKMRSYLLLNNQDSVLSITENALDRYTKYGHREWGARSLMPAVSIFIDRNELHKAQKYLDLFENEGDIYDTNGNLHRDCIPYLHEKGRLLCAKGQYSEAKDCFYELLNAGIIEGGSKGLLCVYESSNVIDSIAKYSKMYAAYNDSSFIGVHREIVAQMTAVYNYNQSQKEKDRIKYQLIKSKSKLTTISNILLLCIVVICLLFYRYSVSKRESIKKINTLNNIIEQDAIEIKNLEMKQKCDDIKYKKILEDSELRAEELKKVNEEYHKNKSDREATILSLKQEIFVLKEQISKSNKVDLITSFYENETYSIFKTCANNGLVSIKKTDWDTLISKFRKVFGDYFDFLHKNALTQDQIRVCILLRLGFKESDMANIMKKNSSQINKIKIQVNKKLFGNEDAKTLRDNLKKYFD